MTHFQQAYTAYPSPAVVVNTPTPMSYQPYSQHPSMQPAYYPSVQPQIIQQPYYPQPGGGYLHNHSSTLSQLCMWLLCLGACTYCCTEGCCGLDDCCGGGGGVYNDDCCGCC